MIIKRIIKHFHEAKTMENAIANLIEESKLKLNFFVMCGLSAILATLGIILNDTAILIAAMVLAPLLNPVLAFAAGISARNKDLMIYSSKSLFGSIFFVILVSALLIKALIFAGFEINTDYFFEKFASYYDLFFITAFVSGFASVYSWLKDTGVGHLVGVAIAVSLVPFVSFFGILLGKGSYAEIGKIYLNFLFNLFFILFGAVFAFLILGVYSFQKEISKEVKQNGD